MKKRRMNAASGRARITGDLSIVYRAPYNGRQVHQPMLQQYIPSRCHGRVPKVMLAVAESGAETPATPRQFRRAQNVARSNQLTLSIANRCIAD